MGAEKTWTKRLNGQNARMREERYAVESALPPAHRSNLASF
jgi:hypothetical protein